MRELIVTEVQITGEKDHHVLPRDEIRELMDQGQVEALYKFRLCERGTPRGRPEQTYKINGPFLQEGRPLATATISTANPDRDKDIVDTNGAHLKDYVQNPVVLPMHTHTFPIGFAEEMRQYKGRLWAQWQWLTDQPDTEAATYQRLWDAYVLNATSIGFRPLKVEEAKSGGWNFVEWELLEFSPVVIPANAEAMREVGDVLDQYGEAVFASGSPIAKSLWTAGEGRERPKQVSVTRGGDMADESHVTTDTVTVADEGAPVVPESGQAEDVKLETLEDAKLAFVAGAIDGDKFATFAQGVVDQLQGERDAAVQEAEEWKSHALGLAAGVVVRG